MAKKTQTVARRAEREPGDGCSFDSIDLQVLKEDSETNDNDEDSYDTEDSIYTEDSNVTEDSNSEISIYTREPYYKLDKEIFFVTNNIGKKIIIDEERKNRNKCRNQNKHFTFLLANEESKEDNNYGAEASIIYKKIPDGLFDFSFLYYFFLPISSKAGFTNSLYLSSCKNPQHFQIVTYPDIKYSISFGCDIKRDDDKSFKPSIKFKFTAEYNKGSRAKKEFEISKGKINPVSSSDLKEKLKSIENVSKLFEALMDTSKILDLIGDTKVSPFKFEPIWPKLALKVKWNYAVSKDFLKIGREININLSADPLIGIKLKIDLLQIGLNFLAPGLGTVVKLILEFVSENDSASVNAYCNLVISGMLNFFLHDFKINTAEEEEGKLVYAPIKGEGKIKIELVAGVSGRVKVLSFVLGAEASASASAAIKGGGAIAYENRKIYFEPHLTFEGLKVVLIIKTVAGLTNKKQTAHSSSTNLNFSREKEFVVIPEKKWFGKENRMMLHEFK